jgi:hypothetical protein
MDIAQVIEHYHSALNAFATGDPAPLKSLYARSDDVLLANPFGGSSRGWKDVSRALDFASSNFRDGKPVRFEEVSCSRHDHIPARGRQLEACRSARGSAHDSACRWPASSLELTERLDEGSALIYVGASSPASSPVGGGASGAPSA